MFHDVELKEASVLANIAGEVSQLLVDSVDVLLQIVLVSHQQAALRADFFGVIVVSFNVIAQLLRGITNFRASRN